MDLTSPTDFERVYDEHAPSVYAAALRVLRDTARAQDVAQDVFIRLWRRPDRFDPARAEIGTYLRLLARSRALDLWREDQAYGRAGDRLRVAVERSESSEPRAEGQPARALECSEDRASVRAALRRLPPAQREALVLAYWGGLTAEQIARRSQVPLGTAKSRIRLGLTRLREEFAADAEGMPAAA